jgi:uncharacterized protein (TIGR02145 family)
MTTSFLNRANFFDNSSINNPTNWVWDFGDGNTSSVQNPSHTYTESGAYTVSLTVSNNIITVTESKDNYIHVIEQYPEGNGIPCPSGSVVTDVDGNYYFTVKIGDQCWMKENLKVTHYPDGSPIQLIESTEIWDVLEPNDYDDAYCYYDNDLNNLDTLGALYSWAAAMGGNATLTSNTSVVQGICPDGWHLPSEEEWMELKNFINGEGGNADDLKTTYGWEENGNGTDTYGFSALPAGWRRSSSSFDPYYDKLGYNAFYWSKTYSGDSAVHMYLYYDQTININYNSKNHGISVRCLKDVP